MFLFINSGITSVPLQETAYTGFTLQKENNFMVFVGYTVLGTRTEASQWWWAESPDVFLVDSFWCRTEFLCFYLNDGLTIFCCIALILPCVTNSNFCRLRVNYLILHHFYTPVTNKSQPKLSLQLYHVRLCISTQELYCKRDLIMHHLRSEIYFYRTPFTV